MPSTVKDSGLSSPDALGARPVSSGNAQKVALEVPVTVNGVRPVGGSDKREPFVEATKTVLVHSAGAVIRLSSEVLAGQLLFLTNDKTKKEVVCQVVKSKSDGNVSGYVELEFTEPVQGFWGLGFPAERASGSPARPAVLAPLGQNMESRPAVSNISAKPSEPDAAVAADEFKTEIKPDSRPMSKADFLAPADPTTQALKIETSRLQEELSTLHFSDPSATETPRAASTPSSRERALSDATAKIFEIAASEPTSRKTEPSPANATTAAPKVPITATPAFEAEEVKIPAWLEPLARNAAIPAPPAPPEPASSSSTSEFEELSAAEPQQPAQASPKRAPVSPVRSAAPAAPVLGRTLIGAAPSTTANQRRGRKGLLIVGVAAGIALATGGITWYLRQSSSFSGGAATNSPAVSAPAAALRVATPPSTGSNAAANAETGPNSKESKGTAGSSSTVRGSSFNSAATLQPAAISERVPKSASLDASKTLDAPPEAEEPEAKRPSLGNVRLAKPKVGHSARNTLSGDAVPTLEADTEQASASELPLSGALLEGSAKKPAIPAPPVPVGGDVVTARLISSVPPAYPALARTQHIAGDVRVDALIDANGRVSTMKVVSGPTLLHQAAMEALRQWKYQPAMLDGKPVSMHLTVTIQFHLQ